MRTSALLLVMLLPGAAAPKYTSPPPDRPTAGLNREADTCLSFGRPAAAGFEGLGGLPIQDIVRVRR